MSEGNSYRQILRSSSIIGGASVINIIVGLLRTKAAAVLLGPAGIGLIGLFNNLVSTASGVAGLGFGNVGTRQIAQASATADAARIVIARRALFWGTLLLAVLGACTFWTLRGVLANKILGEPALAGEIGWLAIAVALSVASASQNALLNGLRRIGDIARVSVGSAILSTIGGIAALWLWGRAGILVFVIAAPLASFLLGHFYVQKLTHTYEQRPRFSELTAECRVLATLGFAFMVAGLAGTAGQLIVRLLVQRELGPDALGQFQAAWAISVTYIGFVLGAMGTDYYPRLTAAFGDHAMVNRLVNEQTEVALLLAAPVLLAMLGFAPWIVELLYSSQFDEAIAVLRWQVLGDVLKIASWPLGFILLASGSGKKFILTEWMAMIIFVTISWVLLPIVGLIATGFGFVGMYIVLFGVVLLLAKRRTRFAYVRTTASLLGGLIFSSATLMVVIHFSEIAGAIVGICAAMAFGLFALVRLTHLGSSSGRVGRLASAVHLRLSKKVFRRGK